MRGWGMAVYSCSKFFKKKHMTQVGSISTNQAPAGHLPPTALHPWPGLLPPTALRLRPGLLPPVVLHPQPGLLPPAALHPRPGVPWSGHCGDRTCWEVAVRCARRPSGTEDPRDGRQPTMGPVKPQCSPCQLLPAPRLGGMVPASLLHSRVGVS